MRAFFAVVLLGALAGGCTPYIAVKDDFGTSALTQPPPNGKDRAEIPPGFAEFNAYNPAVNNLLAEQICATPYEPLDAKTLGASPGRLVQARGRCQSHIPLYGP
ncbi:MAG TPA: hypothetical protein VKQ73_17150 [Stellaceae bacterium]|nr:hypothetical protein [Stellaceae bacterium]